MQEIVAFTTFEVLPWLQGIYMLDGFLTGKGVG